MNAEALAAVHEHVEAVATDAVPVPPSGGNAVTLGGPTVNVHVVVEGVVGVALSLHALTISAIPKHPDAMNRLD